MATIMLTSARNCILTKAMHGLCIKSILPKAIGLGHYHEVFLVCGQDALS